MFHASTLLAQNKSGDDGVAPLTSQSITHRPHRRGSTVCANSLSEKSIHMWDSICNESPYNICDVPWSTRPHYEHKNIALGAWVPLSDRTQAAGTA
jgi:hypothetical protein